MLIDGFTMLMVVSYLPFSGLWDTALAVYFKQVLLPHLDAHLQASFTSHISVSQSHATTK